MRIYYFGIQVWMEEYLDGRRELRRKGESRKTDPIWFGLRWKHFSEGQRRDCGEEIETSTIWWSWHILQNDWYKNENKSMVLSHRMKNNWLSLSDKMMKLLTASNPHLSELYWPMNFGIFSETDVFKCFS